MNPTPRPASAAPPRSPLHLRITVDDDVRDEDAEALHEEVETFEGLKPTGHDCASGVSLTPPWRQRARRLAELQSFARSRGLRLVAASSASDDWRTITASIRH